MIKQNGLDGAFDADGSLRAEKLRELGENVIDGQTDTQGENAQGEGISAAESVQFRFKDGQESKSQDLVDFYQSVLSMKDNAAKNKRKKKIGVVTQEHATLVSDLIKKETGKTIDLSDYEIWINGSAVNHIEDRHGKNGAADKSMADMDNVARIPWALDNATSGEVLKKDDGNLDLDYNYKNSDGSPSVKVRISKEVDNGLLFVAECVPDTNEKKLHILSAYMQQKSSEGQELTHKTQSPPQPTSETVLDSNTATNSIPQNPDLSTASGEKSSGNSKLGFAEFDHRFMSPDLWRREGEVDADLKAISKRSGTQARVFSDELSEGAKKNYRKTKKALNVLNALGGNEVSLVITEPSDTYKGGLVNGRTIYMPADQLESGDWAGTLVHEFTHFEEGTKEYSEMMDYLQSDDILVDDGKGGRAILRDVAEKAVQGKDYGFDAEALRQIVDKADAGEQLTAEEAKALRAYTSEVTAHETEIMLGNEGFIDRIVRQNGTAAERLVGKLLSLDKAFSKMGDKQAKAQRDKIREAERLYLKAATAAGNGSIRKMILSQVPELEDEEVQLARKESKENQGLTIDNYTEEDYNNYGWVRANDVLTAGQMKNFEARFAKVKSKQLKTYKSKQGEYMIPVSDIYDYESEGIENVIVYAKGEIDSPIVTRILEIDLDNETDLDKERRKIYDAERRGIQPPSGNLFRFHHSTDYGYRQYGQGTGTENIGNNSESSVERGRGSKASARLKGFHVNENGSTTYYRADGSEEVKFSLKERADAAKQQMSDDFSDLLASAGIEGEALEIRGDLAELYRIANETDGDGAFKRGLRDSKTGREFLVRVFI